MQLKKTHKYDDIIGLPHPVSAKRASMPLYDRAAQFAPFAALTGYEDAIEESGRLTDYAADLTDGSMQLLNDQLAILSEHIAQTPKVQVTYFVPDTRKEGGSYVTVSGNIKRIDPIEQLLILTDGTKIPLVMLYRLEGELIAKCNDPH